jgi:trigger factor
MSVSVERKGNEATLKVSLPVEDVAKAFEKAVAKINKQVTIPGFRKGKAPPPGPGTARWQGCHQRRSL